MRFGTWPTEKNREAWDGFFRVEYRECAVIGYPLLSVEILKKLDVMRQCHDEPVKGIFGNSY
jgi:hypothetical protein